VETAERKGRTELRINLILTATRRGKRDVARTKNIVSNAATNANTDSYLAFACAFSKSRFKGMLELSCFTDQMWLIFKSSNLFIAFTPDFKILHN